VRSSYSGKRISAGSRHVSTLLHSMDQARKHSFYLTDTGVKSLLLFISQESQIASEQEKVLQLSGGAYGDVQELPELRRTCSAATLGNVRRYRGGGTSHLAGQPVSFGFWKGSGRRINSKSQRMALLPNLQLPVILHGENNQTTIFLSYLQLKTENCQPVVLSCEAEPTCQVFFSCFHLRLHTDNCQLGGEAHGH